MVSTISLPALSFMKHVSQLTELHAEMAKLKSGSKCVFHTSFPGYRYLIMNAALGILHFTLCIEFLSKMGSSFTEIQATLN